MLANLTAAFQALPQTLTEALHEFVEKDNKESMKEAIHRVLQETQVGGVVALMGLGGCTMKEE